MMLTSQVFFTLTSVIIFQYSLYFHPKDLLRIRINSLRLERYGQVTFKNDIANIEWLDVLQADNQDISYDLFITKIKTIYERCFPLSTVKIKRKTKHKP